MDSETHLENQANGSKGGYLADEDKPHNPINDEPDAFDKGMFLAVCPETHDAKEAWAGNPKWPQL